MSTTECEKRKDIVRFRNLLNARLSGPDHVQDRICLQRVWNMLEDSRTGRRLFHFIIKTHLLSWKEPFPPHDSLYEGTASNWRTMKAQLKKR